MKTAAKIFIWIGMIFGAIGIIPLVIGIFALKKINSAKTKDDLTGWGIATVIFCSTLGGILMLCIPENELDGADVKGNNTVVVEGRTVQKQDTTKTAEEELAKAKALYEQGILSETEYSDIRKSVIEKYLK